MARVGRRAALAAIGAATALFACTSPTLPLPPPALPTISAGTEPSTYRLSSVEGALPNALIVVVNRNEAVPREKRVEGTIADERGSWEVTVFASPGDVLEISQESGTSRSSGTSLTVK